MLLMLWNLIPESNRVTKRSCAISWMDGRVTLILHSAVFTTSNTTFPPAQPDVAAQHTFWTYCRKERDTQHLHPTQKVQNSTVADVILHPSSANVLIS